MDGAAASAVQFHICTASYFSVYHLATKITTATLWKKPHYHLVMESDQTEFCH